MPRQPQAAKKAPHKPPNLKVLAVYGVAILLGIAVHYAFSRYVTPHLSVWYSQHNYLSIPFNWWVHVITFGPLLVSSLVALGIIAWRGHGRSAWYITAAAALATSGGFFLQASIIRFNSQPALAFHLVTAATVAVLFAVSFSLAKLVKKLPRDERVRVIAIAASCAVLLLAGRVAYRASIHHLLKAGQAERIAEAADVPFATTYAIHVPQKLPEKLKLMSAYFDNDAVDEKWTYYSLWYGRGESLDETEQILTVNSFHVSYTTFNPPTNCGSDLPNDYDKAEPHPCAQIGSVSNIPVYKYTQPEAYRHTYYAKLDDNTLVTMQQENSGGQFILSDAQVVDIFNSLDVVSPKQFLDLMPLN